MSRYTGPKARVSRRLGINIFGTKGETIALDKRPYPPGEHGRTRRRTNQSEFLVQLHFLFLHPVLHLFFFLII